MRSTKTQIGTRFLTVALLAMVLPPFFATLMTGIVLMMHKSRKYAYLFYAVFILLITYLSFSYDNISRFYISYYGEEDQKLFYGDILGMVVGWFHGKGVQFLNILYGFFLVLYYSWFEAFRSCTSKGPSAALIVVMFCAVIFRNAIDLTYYTLALTLTLWVLGRQKPKWWSFLLTVLLVYLAHPGLLLILLPSIGLYYAMKSRFGIVYFITLGAIAVLYYVLSRVEIPTTGIEALDSLTETFDDYTGTDSQWGVRRYKLSGITYFFEFKVIPFIYLGVAVLSVLFRKKIFNKPVLAIFQTAAIMLPFFFKYVTITERTMVVLSSTSMLTLIMLCESGAVKWMKMWHVAMVAFSIFSFHLLRASAIPLSMIFREGSYDKVRERVFTTPSIVLFDYRDFGFSDEFILRNTVYDSDYKR